MKIDKSYLSKAKEIRDVARGAKKTTQLSTTQVRVGMTLKKRKCPISPGGPSEPLAPKMAPVPSTPVTIPIINLDEDAKGPSHPSVNRALVKTLQSEIPPIISLTPIVETPSPVAPSTLSTTTKDPSAITTSTFVPD